MSELRSDQAKPAVQELCGVSRTDSGISDVSDLLPHIDTTYNGEVPDSVLLLSLGQSLFSPPSKDTPLLLEDYSDNVKAQPDKLNSRVQFTEDEIKMERETIEVLHNFICRNSYNIPRLFAAVTRDSKKNYPFLTDAGLESYIKCRSFIFSIAATAHNRGYGYRDNFVNIVRYVDSKCSNGGYCTIQELLEKVINNLPVYSSEEPQSIWNDTWFTEHKMDEQELEIFLTKEHSEIFNVETRDQSNGPRQIFVRLTGAAYKIPSLWQNCLPKMPVTLLWDESRVYSFTTSISYVHEHHAIATIQTGIFRGRLVYIHRSRVGPPDLRRALAVGGMLSVTAHMTWNTTAQFRALSVVNNFASYEIKKINGRSQSYDRDEYNSNGRRDARATFVYRALLRRAADSERQMVKFADDLLADAMYSHDGLQRRLHKYKSSHRNSPFTNFQELEFFLMQRPHLYHFDSLGAKRTTDKEREIAIAFIEMINGFGFSGASKQELRHKLVNSNYPLKSIVVDRSLDEYIQQISPVFEVIRLLNPVEDIVMLRGIYIADERLFVHHFKPSFLPTD